MQGGMEPKTIDVNGSFTAVLVRRAFAAGGDLRDAGAAEFERWLKALPWQGRRDVICLSDLNAWDGGLRS